MSFRVTSWIEDRGFLGSFAIYGAVLAVLSCLLPFMYAFGKPMRKWTAGTINRRVQTPLTGPTPTYSGY